MTTIKIKKINPKAIIPQKNSLSAAGYDLYANTSEEIEIMNAFKIIETFFNKKEK